MGTSAGAVNIGCRTRWRARRPFRVDKCGHHGDRRHFHGRPSMSRGSTVGEDGVVISLLITWNDHRILHGPPRNVANDIKRVVATRRDTSSDT